MAANDKETPQQEKPRPGFFSDAIERAKKALEATSSKAEETSRKAMKFTEEIAESVTNKAEAAVEATVKKIREIRYTEEEHDQSVTSKVLQLKPRAGMTAAKQIDEIGTGIIDYLGKNGETTLDKITNVMKRRKNSQLFVLCAIGWLLHDQKVKIGADNTTLAIKQQKTKS